MMFNNRFDECGNVYGAYPLYAYDDETGYMAAIIGADCPYEEVEQAVVEVISTIAWDASEIDNLCYEKGWSILWLGDCISINVRV